MCYYCGKNADYECDAIDSGSICRREVCEEHSVPEFESGRRSDFTLCKDHAHLQHKRNESTLEYFARIEREAKEVERG
jgi:hypothetical protein